MLLVGSYDDWYNLLDFGQMFHSSDFLLNIKLFSTCSMLKFCSICKFFLISSLVLIFLQLYIISLKPCLRRKYGDF